jgi:hypothetical protein
VRRVILLVAVRAIGNERKDHSEGHVVGQLETERQISDRGEPTPDHSYANQAHGGATSCSPQGRLPVGEASSKCLPEGGRDAGVRHRSQNQVGPTRWDKRADRPGRAESVPPHPSDAVAMHGAETRWRRAEEAGCDRRLEDPSL